jgi:hypothetical protein
MPIIKRVLPVGQATSVVRDATSLQAEVTYQLVTPPLHNPSGCDLKQVVKDLSVQEEET